MSEVVRACPDCGQEALTTDDVDCDHCLTRLEFRCLKHPDKGFLESANCAVCEAEIAEAKRLREQQRVRQAKLSSYRKLFKSGKIREAYEAAIQLQDQFNETGLPVQELLKAIYLLDEIESLSIPAVDGDISASSKLDAALSDLFSILNLIKAGTDEAVKIEEVFKTELQKARDWQRRFTIRKRQRVWVYCIITIIAWYSFSTAESSSSFKSLNFSVVFLGFSILLFYRAVPYYNGVSTRLVRVISIVLAVLIVPFYIAKINEIYKSENFRKATNRYAEIMVIDSDPEFSLETKKLHWEKYIEESESTGYNILQAKDRLEDINKNIALLSEAEKKYESVLASHNDESVSLEEKKIAWESYLSDFGSTDYQVVKAKQILENLKERLERRRVYGNAIKAYAQAESSFYDVHLSDADKITIWENYLSDYNKTDYKTSESRANIASLKAKVQDLKKEQLQHKIWNDISQAITSNDYQKIQASIQLASDNEMTTYITELQKGGWIQWASRMETASNIMEQAYSEELVLKPGSHKRHFANQYFFVLEQQWDSISSERRASIVWAMSNVLSNGSNDVIFEIRNYRSEGIIYTIDPKTQKTYFAASSPSSMW